jgi:hypothetical protein
MSETNYVPELQSSTSPLSTSSSPSSSLFAFDLKTVLIILLLSVLILVFLGINILTILGNFIQNVYAKGLPILKDFTNAFRLSTGEVINKSADVTTDAAKLGIDIAGGTAHSVGNLIKGDVRPVDTESKPDADDKPENKLEKTVQKDTSRHPQDPSPDSSENTIQKPITSGKMNWCLVGEYMNKRACVPVTESDVCLSKQIFPTKPMCLNPTLTPN